MNTEKSSFKNDYVIYDKGNDSVLKFSTGDIIIFGNKEEALNDCRGNESVIPFLNMPIKNLSDLDGDTIGKLLEESCMSDQILKQLFLMASDLTVNNLMEERESLIQQSDLKSFWNNVINSTLNNKNKTMTKKAELAFAHLRFLTGDIPSYITDDDLYISAKDFTIQVSSSEILFRADEYLSGIDPDSSDMVPIIFDFDGYEYTSTNMWEADILKNKLNIKIK